MEKYNYEINGTLVASLYAASWNEADQEFDRLNFEISTGVYTYKCHDWNDCTHDNYSEYCCPNCHHCFCWDCAPGNCFDGDLTCPNCKEVL